MITMALIFFQVGRVEAASVGSSEGTLRQVDAAPTERNAEPEKLDDGN